MAMPEMCKVLDQIEGRFSLQMLIEKAQELDPPIDLDVKRCGAPIAAMAKIGALTTVPNPQAGT